jgi:hypothetical protein
MVAAGSFLQLLKLEKRGLATTLQAAMYADITITVGEPADHEVGQESVLWIRITLMQIRIQRITLMRNWTRIRIRIFYLMRIRIRLFTLMRIQILAPN